MTRGQVLGFRLRGAQLHARTPDLNAAVTEVGLPDFPPGAAAQALAPRLSHPDADSLETAFAERALVRLRAMRGAPVVVPTPEAELFAAAVLPPDEKAMRAFLRPATKSIDAARMTALDAVALVTEETERLLQSEPLDRDQLHAQLRRRLPKGLLPKCAGCGTHHVHPSVLYAVALQARLFIFPRADGPYQLVLASQWLRGKRQAAARKAAARQWTPTAARQELVRRFLRVYGPAGTSDFASWAGVSVAQTGDAWQALASELVPVVVKDAPAAKRFILASDSKALSASEGKSASAGKATLRLLAPGDPFLQMRDREMLAPETMLAKVIWKNLAPTGVVMAGPTLMGLARVQKKKDVLQVTIERLGALTPPLRSAVQEEADNLARVRACSRAEVRFNG